jgi:formate hydrogenlyase transcriptional activator
MDLPVENLFQHGRTEYLTLDQDLRITGFSDGAGRLADDLSSVQVGNDVRYSFPELVGVEDDLQAVREGKRDAYVIRGLCRQRPPNAPLYVTVRVELLAARGSGTHELAVILEDVTEWMTELQTRTQTSNEASLLIHALTASKDYIENIFEALAEALIVTAPDGRINAMNRAALSLSEYTPREIIGQPIAKLLPDEPSLVMTSTGVGVTSDELSLRTRSGNAIPVSVSRAPLRTDDNIVHAVVYLGRDLRERQEAQERILSLETKYLSLHEALKTNQDTADIVWASPAMAALMKDLMKVAGTDTTVLISGETGTGKELVARAIHHLSSRKGSLLVTVNCAALPAGLVESELFGHEKGAFTGALQKRIGKFELADGGTVFLDEVGELPLATQTALLRVLQEKVFERVGGSAPISINVRVLAATNRDLDDEVRQGRFREDLLFRLNVFPLHVPPLRERPEDIPLLAEHFIRSFKRRMNKEVTGFSKGARHALEKYSWPGNVRELANVIERAMIVCDKTVLEESDLALANIPRKDDRRPATFNDMARQHLLHTLKECDGVIEGPNGAAARLGLKPATLRSRMKKLGLSRVGRGFRAIG